MKRTIIRTVRKANFLPLAAMALCMGILVSSCSDDNDNPTPEPGEDLVDVPVQEGGLLLAGEIADDVTLEADRGEYILSGGVRVAAGATLTIEAGTVVKSDVEEAATAYLAILPGAKIMATGTADNPIVFTSGEESPAVQDWGGIILLGNAPINPQGGTAASEMVEVPYGGTDADDNSGVLSYVRVEYGGAVQTEEKEHNGFTFEGVGAGTELNHLSVYVSGDDGVEFFGGTASLKYATVVGAEDDSFDWTYGWRGNGQFWVVVQKPVGETDHCFEGDNNGDGNDFDPQSNANISNVTLIGAVADGDQVLLRQGTAGKFYNMVVAGSYEGLTIESPRSTESLNAGDLVVNYSDFFYSSDYQGYTLDAGANEALITANNTFTTGSPEYLEGHIGTTGSEFDPQGINDWFDSAPYKGAVQADADWTAEGSWARFE